jgi:hypothetical protein
MSLANVAAPRGFILHGQGGATGVHRVRRRAASGRSKDLMPGDAYTILSDGTVRRAVTGGEPNGIVEGIELNSPNSGVESSDYIAAADAGYLIGIEDPLALFRVQTSDDFEETNGGDLFDVVDADGSQTLAQSRQKVGNGGSGQDFRAVELLQDTAANAYGTNAWLIVRLARTL